jgi:membrane protease YdiL (CAAX protease family)
MPTADMPLSLGMKLFIGAGVCGSAIVWALIAWRVWRRQPLVAYEPRQPVPWGANDLVLVVLLIFLLGFVALQAMMRLEPRQPEDVQSEAGYYVSSAVELVGVALGILVLNLQAGAGWRDFGFDTKRLVRNLGLGAAAFLAIAVPIFGLQWVLDKIVTYTHPVLKSLHAQPDARMFVATTVAALVAAPLFEEFLFRVLLQGWFEAIEARRRVLRLGLPGDGPAWWPIVLSAFLFAGMHWNNGLAVIPLFFFAIVLGYVYQRTHRIWPSMATHFLLNAWTMLFLWYQIHHGVAA